MRVLFWLFAVAFMVDHTRLPAAVVFDATSAYHHIRVVDDRGLRILSFDGSFETRMSLLDPKQGHFEYTEYFHMPWLWNQHLTNVLMVGLGGASTQRSFQYYCQDVIVETAEIDSMVLKVARDYFQFRDSPTNKVTISDGRVFLRRSQQTYDAILMDAYVKSRYGSFIPHHLATKEFFQLANEHLSTNGVLAYNVIGTLHGWRADVLGAVYRTMKSVFPQVYLFPANDSYNVVLVGTKVREKLTLLQAREKAAELLRSGRTFIPTFANRVAVLRTEAPPSFLQSPLLTDDYAPVDGLLRGRN
jgi:spermidine synthase